MINITSPETTWEYLDYKLSRAERPEFTQEGKEYLEDILNNARTYLLNPTNQKEFKTFKQKQKSIIYSRTEKYHNPNYNEFGLYRLKDMKYYISKYQQKYVESKGIRGRTQDNKTAWFIFGTDFLYPTKVEFQGALHGLNIPYFKNKVSDGEKYFYQRYEGDIDRGVLKDAWGYEGDAKTFIKNTRNSWKPQEKVKEFAPNYASNICLGSRLYGNEIELLQFGNPKKTGMESIELVNSKDEVYGTASSYDTFSEALEAGKLSGTSYLISNSKTTIYLTWEDGKIHKEFYGKRGYVLILLYNPKNIDDEVFFTDSKNRKKNYYSQNINKNQFSVNEMQLPLFAILNSMGAKAISYNAPLCEAGYTMYGSEVQDFDTIVQNLGAKRNVDVTCKKYANSTYKQMQPTIMGLGGNYKDVLKICAYKMSEDREYVDSLSDAEKMRWSLNLVDKVASLLDKEHPKPFNVMGSARQRIADTLLRAFHKDPDILHRIGCSCGSLIRYAAQRPEKYLAKKINAILGYTIEGLERVAVFVADKIVDFTKFLNEGIAETYSAIYEEYKNIGLKTINIGWQKRYSIVYGDS